MKIVCRKETNAGQTLSLIGHLLETRYSDYPFFKDKLVVELCLQDREGECCPDDDTTIFLEEENLRSISKLLEASYQMDTLTKLYNRDKYEHDIDQLEKDCPECFTCIYIDAVGLHEINNHLGHAAGDSMLCRIADTLRQYFADDQTYRIGGDEFVIFCLHTEKAILKHTISELRKTLRENDYEISIGMETRRKGRSISDTINRAEYAMRYDKTQFYNQNGKQRQVRELNHKLEKILLEKQDASQFLNVIASGYKGVYMVDPDTDSCRYIYIPEYFDKILKHNHGIYSRSIRDYCHMFVSQKDQDAFSTFLDYDNILKQLRQGRQLLFPYEKKDGSYVRLQITLYNPDAPDSREMLWIFIDDDK